MKPPFEIVPVSASRCEYKCSRCGKRGFATRAFEGEKLVPKACFNASQHLKRCKGRK